MALCRDESPALKISEPGPGASVGHACWCGRPKWPAGLMAALLFLRRLQHLLAGRGQLVGLLGEAGDDPPAAGDDALAVFLVVALAGVALLGGQFLRQCGLGQAE